MKMVVYIAGALGVMMALSAPASACPQIPFGPANLLCPREPQDPPEPPPPPPPEQNRLAGPDGNPAPGQTRCGDMQISVAQCPMYQEFARTHCINNTEYIYAQAHSIAPVCGTFDTTIYIGYCFCGCLERSTDVWVQDPDSGEDRMQQIDSILAGSALAHAFTDETTLSAVSYAPRQIEATTAGGEQQPLVVLQLQDGTTLGASELHAVLVSTGMMVAAKDLQVGQKLVKQDGATSAIVDITRTPTDDDVFNLLTDAGLNHLGHMIVANGVIVGDLMWQNTLAKDLNAIVVRQ